MLPVMDRRIDQILFPLQPSIEIAGSVRIIEAKANRIHLIAKPIILIIAVGCSDEWVAAKADNHRRSVIRHDIRHDLLSPIRTN